MLSYGEMETFLYGNGLSYGEMKTGLTGFLMKRWKHVFIETRMEIEVRIANCLLKFEHCYLKFVVKFRRLYSQYKKVLHSSLKQECQSFTLRAQSSNPVSDILIKTR